MIAPSIQRDRLIHDPKITKKAGDDGDAHGRSNRRIRVEQGKRGVRSPLPGRPEVDSFTSASATSTADPAAARAPEPGTRTMPSTRGPQRYGPFPRSR